MPGKLMLQQGAKTLLCTTWRRPVIIRQIKMANSQLHRTPDNSRILCTVITTTEIMPKP